MTDVALAFGAHPDVADSEMAAVINLEKQLAQVWSFCVILMVHLY